MAVTTTDDATFNQIARKGKKLNQFVAASQKVIGDEASTRTLTANEAGALCLFDLAAGVTYTLPTIDRTEQVGMYFDFFVNVVGTGTYKVITGAATEFLLGSIVLFDKTIATSGDIFDADGSTIVALAATSDVTGRLLGGKFRVTAINLTQWVISGYLQEAGTALTPFATS
jgi:hypothetical protein